MPTTLTGWAEHVVQRMREVGARDLVGLSFGSSIALQAALDFPNDVDRLVLAAPTLSGRADDPQARTRYLTMATSMFRGVTGRALAEVWMSGPPDIFTGLRRHPDRFGHVASVIERHTFAELRTGAMAPLARAQQRPEQLRSLTARVLVLIGQEDMPTFRENAEIIAAAVPSARLVWLNDCGHLPLLEEPDRCAPHLAAFVGAAGEQTVRLHPAAAAHP